MTDLADPGQPAGAPPADVHVRPCFEQDVQWVHLIYAHHVLTGAGTFEIDPPSLAEMQRRWREIVASGWPFLVACPAADPSRILGYAYARPFRERAAYRFTFEDSVYVAPGQAGRGVGKALLNALLVTLIEDGARQVVAVIGDSANHPSIRLHQALGFREVGVLRDVGAKFGRWFDVVMMQRTLPTLPKAEDAGD